MMRRALLLVGLGCFGAAGLLGGCSESSLGLNAVPRPESEMDAGMDAAPADAEVADASPQAPSARVIQLSPWPGRGLQIAVELGEKEMGAEPPKLWVEGPSGESLSAQMSKPEAQPGITAILVVPASLSVLHAQRLATAEAVIKALPEGESLILLSARDTPVLMADRSTDRAHALKRLSEIEAEGGWTAAAVLSAARSMLADCGGKSGPLYKSLVVIGEAASDDPALPIDPVQSFALSEQGTPETKAAEFIAQQAARRASIVRIGACAGLKKDAPFKLHLGDTITGLSAPEPIDHLLNMACDPEEAAFDDYPFPYQIDLTFSADERAVYDDRIATLSEEPFRASLKLGVGTAIGAEAHLHGNSSLNCERKGFSVHLDGKGRRLMPGVSDDRFLLISMCLDERYFGQMWADRLLAPLGLYPSRVRYVRLKIDGENRGVYLMVQRPEDVARTDNVGTSSVIRRRYESQGEPAEVKYPEDPLAASAALAAFDELSAIATGAAPNDVAPNLDARLDLDAYLRWLAAYSLLLNGDYIDEAFFYASAEKGSPFHRVMGWDLDDLYTACHNGGFDAIADSCGLTYCAEAPLDEALLRSPEVYQRYLKALFDVLAALPPQKLEATMNEVQNELFQLVSDDETCAALVEMVSENPGAAKVMGARADISSHMSAMLSAALARRTALENGLGVCVP